MLWVGEKQMNYIRLDYPRIGQTFVNLVFTLYVVCMHTKEVRLFLLMTCKETLALPWDHFSHPEIYQCNNQTESLVCVFSFDITPFLYLSL